MNTYVKRSDAIGNKNMAYIIILLITLSLISLMDAQQNTVFIIQFIEHTIWLWNFQLAHNKFKFFLFKMLISNLLVITNLKVRSKLRQKYITKFSHSKVLVAFFFGNLVSGHFSGKIFSRCASQILYVLMIPVSRLYHFQEPRLQPYRKTFLDTII
jgi:hypothetical protein